MAGYVHEATKRLIRFRFDNLIYWVNSNRIWKYWIICMENAVLLYATALPTMWSGSVKVHVCNLSDLVLFSTGSAKLKHAIHPIFCTVKLI